MLRIMLQNLITVQNVFFVAIVLSWFLVLQLVNQKYSTSSKIQVGRFVLTLETERGKELFEYIAQKYRQLLEPLGTVGTIMTFLMMIGGVLFFSASAISSILSPESVQSISTANYLLIPGINDYLPLSVAVEIILGLFIAMVLHEGAHAVYCRLGNITVESSGLLFFSYLPAGAFVRPNEDEVENAEYLDTLRMLSAGILSNMVSSIIFIAIFVIITSQLVAPAVGVSVSGSIEGSPANSEGIESAQITTVNNSSVSSVEDIQTATENNNTVTIQTSTGESYSFTKQLSVQQTIPQVTELPVGSQIKTVNGSEISSVQQYQEIAQNSQTLSLTTTKNKTYTIPTGATILLSNGSYYTVQSINGTSIATGEEFSKVFSEESTGESTPVTINTGETQVIDRSSVEQVYRGTAGVTVTDTGLVYTNTSLYDAFFDPIENDTPITQWIALFFLFPLITLVGGSTVFYGFADEITQYYTITGGEPMFFLATVLYWTAWISINLAVFNALPISILDGGQMVKATIEELSDKYNLTKTMQKTLLYSIYGIAGFSVLTLMILPILV